jgi:hypothetical protein
MINRQPSIRSDIYGHRARIGYTCPPLSAEAFPYEFYKLVPAGVTLVITTLTVFERSQSEVDAAYEMSMRAARELAAAWTSCFSAACRSISPAAIRTRKTCCTRSR